MSVVRMAGRRVVRLQAGPPAGYALVETVLPRPRTLRVGAGMDLGGLRVRRGTSRGVIVLGAGGQGLQAGMARDSAGRLRWAIWSVRAGRTTAVTRGRAVTPGSGATRLVLSTAHAGAGPRAILRVDGRRVASFARPLPRFRTVGIGVAKGSHRAVGSLVVLRGAAVVTSPVPAAPTIGAAAPAAPAVPAPASATPAASPVEVTPPTSAPTPAPPAGAEAAMPGREVARLDFENGLHGAHVQAVSPARVSLVSSPLLGGRFAGRFEVRDGDTPIDENERTEVTLDTGEAEGMERWYSWGVYFDHAFPHGGQWQIVTQWHSTAPAQPPVSFTAEGDVFRLLVIKKNADGSQAAPARTIWSAPLRRGEWYRLMLHVKWSSNDAVGFVELYVNGVRVAGKTYIRTLAPGSDNYTKLGYYRDAGTSGTGVVYIDEFRATQVSPR